MLIYPAIFLVSALLVYLLNQLELIPSRWLPADTHWTEQARRLWPVRTGNLAKIYVLPVGLIAACKLYHFPSETPVLLIASLAGTFLGCYPQDRAIFPKIRLLRWLSLSFRNLIILVLSHGMLVMATLAMPARMDTSAWVLAIAVILWHLGIQFGLGITLMQYLRVLTPAPPSVESMVRDISEKMGVSVRRVWKVDWLQANAMAFVVTRDIGYTGNLLNLFTNDELAAITAHECGHLRESRWMVGLRLMQSAALTPIIFFTPTYSNYGANGILFLYGIAMGIFMLQRLYSQKLERRADALAAGFATNPAIYAQALEKLHRYNRVPAVVGKGNSATHPNLYDRMITAGVTPAYPRPTLPSTFSISLLVIPFVSAILLMLGLKGS